MVYTDKCEIKRVNAADQFGDNTSASPNAVICREEATDKVRSTQEGNQLSRGRLYFLPPNVTINEGDEIRTTERRGVTVIEKFFSVDEVFHVGRFKPHHIEVTVYNV